MTSNTDESKPILVLGGNGKTGRRVVERLTAHGLPVRVGSRSGEPPFDWEDRASWAPALDGVRAVYLTYYPELAVPGATEAVRSLAELARSPGGGSPSWATSADPSGRGSPPTPNTSSSGGAWRPSLRSTTTSAAPAGRCRSSSSSPTASHGLGDLQRERPRQVVAHPERRQPIARVAQLHHPR